MRTQRVRGVDFLKGLAIISMIFIHIPMMLVRDTDKVSVIYQLLNAIAFFSAPLFLFFVGYHSYTMIQKSRTKEFVVRAFILSVLGFVFSMLWTADIMHVIGVFMLISILFVRINPLNNTLIIIIITLISMYLQTTFDYFHNWVVIPHVYVDMWTIQGFVEHMLFNGVYPFFPWYSFVLTGIIIASLNEAKSTKYRERLNNWFFIVGAICLMIGIISMMLLDAPYSFYPPSSTYVIIAIGVILMLFTAFVARDYTYSDPITRFVRSAGAHSLSLYIGHIYIGLGLFYITGVFSVYSLQTTLVYTTLLCVVLTSGCSWFAKRYKYGPIELLMRIIASK